MLALKHDLNELIITLRDRMRSANRIKAGEAGALIERFKKQVEDLKKRSVSLRTIKYAFCFADSGHDHGVLKEEASAEVEDSIKGFEEKLRVGSFGFKKNLVETSLSNHDQEPSDDELKKFMDRGTGLAVQLCFLLVDFFLLMSDADKVIEIIGRFKSTFETIMELRDLTVVDKVVELLGLGEREANMYKNISVEETASVKETEDFIDSFTREFCTAISYLECFLSNRTRDFDSIERDAMEEGLNECEEAMNRIESEIVRRQEKLSGKDELLAMKMECAVIKIWLGIAEWE